MCKQVLMGLVIGFAVGSLGLSVGAGNPDDSGFRQELGSMKGTWRQVSGEADGKTVSAEAMNETVMTRDEAGRVVLRRGDKVIFEATVKRIDSGTKPKMIDTEITAGADKGKTAVGIYEVDGDTLRLCVPLAGNARPTDFSGKAGSRCILSVFEREKRTFAQDTNRAPAVLPEQQKQIDALTEKMMLAMMAGKHAEALLAVDKLIELCPAHGDFYMGRGESLRFLGRKDEAIAAYGKASTLSKNPIVRGDACRGLALLLSEQGKHAEVIAACNRGIECYPATVDKGTVAYLWYRRAAARTQAADMVNALADLKKAIELRSEYKSEAAKDAAFKALYDNADFRILTK